MKQETLAISAEQPTSGKAGLRHSQMAVIIAFLFLSVMASPAQIVVEPPGATVAGKTIAEWSSDWWRWAAALAPPGDPFTDTSGQFANVNQSGPVFFLAGSPGGSRSRWFNVPMNKYVLVPLVAGEYSQLELGFDRTAAQIREAAQQQADLIDSLHATLDGVTIPLATLVTHREASPDFNFVAVANNQVGIFAQGASGIAVADGYFLMLSPLSPGVHALNYGGGVSVFGSYVDETDTITVGAPEITVQPTNQTVLAGETVAVLVGAAGSAPLGYQWYYSPVVIPTNGPYGQPMSNSNTNALRFTATPASAGVYWVRVTNLVGGVNSSLAILTVSPNPPLITVQPADQGVFTGSNAVFNVSATTTNPPLNFQWQFNGLNLFQATNDTLIVSNSQVANIGEYRVLVGDPFGSTNSTPAYLTLLDRPPFIVSQPDSAFVAPGSNALFTVEAGGAAPLAYQWQFNQNTLPGATMSTLVITNAQSFHAGSYAVTITNNYGAITSAPASLLLGWVRTHNGPRNGQDAAQSVAVDIKGDVLVTGYSSDGYNSDYYTAKYAAPDGSLLWEKTLTNGIATALVVDGADNVIVTGSSGSFDSGQGLADYLTVKYAGTDGQLLWQKRFNGPANNNDYPFAIAVDTNGNPVVTGYALAGSTSADYYTAKYAAANGALLWDHYYHGPARDTADAVVVDRSGNVVVTGYVWNGSNDDCYTAKYAAANGALLWEKFYNGPGNGNDRFQAIAIDSSNNVVLTGFSGNLLNDEFYTAKYAAANGALLWEKRYHGPAGHYASARTLAVDAAGNVLVTGIADEDYYTAKYAAADGALLWEKRYDGPGHGYNYPTALVLDASGNAVVTGSSYNADSSTYDCYTVVYASSDGAVLWDYRRQSTDIISLAVDSQNNVVLAGSTGSGSAMDYQTIKIFANRLAPASYRFTSITLTNGNLQLQWTAASGLEVQRSPSLSLPDWQTVAGSANTNRLQVPATGPAGYFRLFKP